VLSRRSIGHRQQQDGGGGVEHRIDCHLLLGQCLQYLGGQAVRFDPVLALAGLLDHALQLFGGLGGPPG
jgi:hypothetical protein